MLDAIHKSLEELLSNFYSVIHWPEIGSNSGRCPCL